MIDLCRLCRDNERANLHRAIPDRLQYQLPFLVPSTQRLEQLHDLVPSPLSHVVNANRAHLDIVIEQKVKEGKQSLELVVLGNIIAAWRLPTWRECAVRNRRASDALYGLGDA